MRWARKITQSNKFPDEPRTSLKIKLEAPKTFGVSIRYPAWVADGQLKVSVNGQSVQVTAHPGGYADVSRQWNDGDTIDVELPMQLHTEMLPHSESYASILYGPIVLAGELGREGLLDSDFRGQMMSDKKVEPVKSTPAIIDSPGDITSHIEPIAGQPLHFKTRDLLKPADATLAPLYEIFDQRYAVYWRLTTSQNWEADQASGPPPSKPERDLAAKTIDHVRPGEQPTRSRPSIQR